MVTTEVPQLSYECGAWRQSLRSYRDAFIDMKHHLQNIAGRKKKRDALLQLEHLDNQFYIQLINIHDLKQEIKVHDRTSRLEMIANGGQVTEHMLSEHERLHDEFRRLEQALEVVNGEYNDFCRK